MPKITYVKTSGERQTLDVDVGKSLMEAARRSGIDGIDGDCGGSLSCGTCHVFVDAAWIDKLDPMEESEQDMLEIVLLRQPLSRMSCQIKVAQHLDGLLVYIPENQQTTGF